MAVDGSDPLALPAAPPPRPAARREAMDAAMRRFDGIEDAAGARPKAERPGWLRSRPAGALATAALLAVISVPTARILLRDPVPRTAQDEAGPTTTPAAPVQQAPARQPAPTDIAAAPAAGDAGQPLADDRPEPVQARDAQKAGAETPPPAMAAAPPAPPPPPAAALNEGESDVVVTGSRIAQPSLGSPSPVTIVEERANESTAAQADPYSAAMARLRAALRADDRQAVIGQIGFPLRVNLPEGSRTYRSAEAVAQDYERIFTPAVRAAVLDQTASAFRRKARGKGTSRIALGPSPGDGTFRIREVTP